LFIAFRKSSKTLDVANIPWVRPQSGEFLAAALQPTVARPDSSGAGRMRCGGSETSHGKLDKALVVKYEHPSISSFKL
jgi:hypothetical protein